MINENQEMWKIIHVNGAELGCTSLPQEMGNVIRLARMPDSEFEIVSYDSELKEFYVE